MVVTGGRIYLYLANEDDCDDLDAVVAHALYSADEPTYSKGFPSGYVWEMTDACVGRTAFFVFNHCCDLRDGTFSHYLNQAMCDTEAEAQALVDAETRKIVAHCQIHDVWFYKTTVVERMTEARTAEIERISLLQC